jgi:hypothetical protein
MIGIHASGLNLSSFSRIPLKAPPPVFGFTCPLEKIVEQIIEMTIIRPAGDRAQYSFKIQSSVFRDWRDPF